MSESSRPKTAYRVVDQDGCRIVYGSIPLDDVVSLTKGMSKKAVLDIEATTLFGATMVFGLPDDLARLKANAPRRTVDPRFVELIGQGAANWVETARVGVSSNFLLHHLTGFDALAWLHREDPLDEPSFGYPMDPSDFKRCRMLLESAPELRVRLPEVSSAHPVWERLVERWDELCEKMDEEAPDWRNADCGSKAPRTAALLRDIAKEPEPSKSARPLPRLP